MLELWFWWKLCFAILLSSICLTEYIGNKEFSILIGFTLMLNLSSTSTFLSNSQFERRSQRPGSHEGQHFVLSSQVWKLSDLQVCRLYFRQIESPATTRNLGWCKSYASVIRSICCTNITAEMLCEWYTVKKLYNGPLRWCYYKLAL